MRNLRLVSCDATRLPGRAFARGGGAGRDLAPPPPGGVIVSADGRIVISAWVCAELSGPISGVPGPDYVPGVDAEGRAVTPADLPGGAPPVWLGDVPIEIDADLQKRFGIPADSKLFRGKDIAGLVIVRDNRAYFNGEPIGRTSRRRWRRPAARTDFDGRTGA